MYNELFSIGPFTVHMYGLMIAIGIIAAYLSAEKLAKRRGLDAEKIFGLVIWCVIFGFAGSKLLYCLTVLPDIVRDPAVILRDLGDGWVVYGGILGGILGGWLYCRRNRLNTWKYFDLGLASVALAQGFGRIGCFFAGCCYGRETSLPIGITFHNSNFAQNGVALFPTQILSSIFDFLLFGFLVWFYKRRKADGQITALYLILYSAGRFVIEFFRGDLIRGSVGALSTSQFIAIFVFAAGVVLFCLRSKGGTGAGEEAPEQSAGTDAEQEPGQEAEEAAERKAGETAEADAEQKPEQEAEETAERKAEETAGTKAE